MAGTDRSNVVLLEAQRYSEGTPGAIGKKSGHFGNNHPEHLDKVNMLGLKRTDLVALAMLRPGMFFVNLNFSFRISMLSYEKIVFHQATTKDNFVIKKQNILRFRTMQKIKMNFDLDRTYLISRSFTRRLTEYCRLEFIEHLAILRKSMDRAIFLYLVYKTRGRYLVYEHTGRCRWKSEKAHPVPESNS